MKPDKDRSPAFSVRNPPPQNVSQKLAVGPMKKGGEKSLATNVSWTVDPASGLVD